MKTNLVKKSIGLIVGMAMMAGLMFISGTVETKAAAWPGEPELGDKIILGDGNEYTNVTPGSFEVTVEGSVYKICQVNGTEICVRFAKRPLRFFLYYNKEENKFWFLVDYDTIMV